MTDCSILIAKALDMGATDAKAIDTAMIVFDDRSFIKCRFGCNRWGRYWTCPPNLHISPEMFMKAFEKYSSAVIIQAPDPHKGQEITLALEKEAMLAGGSPFAFGMALCVQCEECSYPDPCRFPHMARPSMDAYGIDIGATVAPLGFEVKFDPQGRLLPAWYSMVLVA